MLTICKALSQRQYFVEFLNWDETNPSIQREGGTQISLAIRQKQMAEMLMVFPDPARTSK